MIQFNTIISNLLQEPTINAFYLVKINQYKTTTHYSNLLLSNNDLYLADGRLVQVDSPKLSASVDREIYKVSLADPDFLLSTGVDDGLVGKVFEVRIGFIKNSTNLPYTEINNTILAYKGIVDNVAYSFQLGDIGETIVTVSGASPMANLDAVRPFYSSREYLRSLAINDVSCDQIYEGAGQINLRWGKG